MKAGPRLLISEACKLCLSKGRFAINIISHMKLFSRREKGFTLIELLVVIAIIGILAGIVLVSLGGARTSARDARRQSDIRQIVTAQELFYNDTSAYVASATMPTAIGTYLAAVPKDPGAGTPVYGWVSNASSAGDYCTYATLEKASATSGNKLFFVGGPGGVKQRDQIAAYAFTLADCE